MNKVQIEGIPALQLPGWEIDNDKRRSAVADCSRQRVPMSIVFHLHVDGSGTVLVVSTLDLVVSVVVVSSALREKQRKILDHATAQNSSARKAVSSCVACRSLRFFEQAVAYPVSYSADLMLLLN